MSDESTNEPEENTTSQGGPGAYELPEWVEEQMFRDFLGALPPVLEEIDASALAIGAEEEDEEKLAEIRRRVHTLKGEAYVLGLDHLGDVCHGLETYLEECATHQRSDAVLVMIDWTRVGIEHWAVMQHPPETAEKVLDRLGSPPDSTQANFGLRYIDIEIGWTLATPTSPVVAGTSFLASLPTSGLQEGEESFFENGVIEVREPRTDGATTWEQQVLFLSRYPGSIEFATEADGSTSATLELRLEAGRRFLEPPTE